ncbi:hypothetical protein [Methylobacterium sp. ID0610]|uniref:hypothetical protein n=1 Tax=Methylobacterium carpenticola TaxID=3344827 RepID=UPI0036C86361
MSQLYPSNPVRRLVVKEWERAAARGEDYEPGVDELRAILRKALRSQVARVRWMHQAGCTSTHLEAVLDGREDPDDRIQDCMGVIWVPGRGVYADPLFDRDARVIQQERWAEEIRAKLSGPLQPCPRIERYTDAPLPDMFAIGAGSPGPRKKG